MNGQSDPRLVRRLRVFSAGASLFSMAVGLSALAGWAFHIAILKSWLPGQVSMRFNAAVCFVLLGFALVVLRRRGAQAGPRQLAARMAAAIVILAGVLTLLESLLGWDLGIDQLLYVVRPGDEVGSGHPGLIPPVAALGLALLGAALLILDWKTRRDDWPAQWLAITAAVVSAFGILDFALGRQISHTHIALPSALTLTVVSLGAVCARADWALGGLLTSQGAGARWLRRAGPAALAVLAFLGWLLSKPLLTEVHFTWMEVSAIAIVSSLLLAGLIAWAALLLDHSEVQRRKAEEILRLPREQIDLLWGRFEDSPVEAVLRRWVTAGICFAVLLTGFTGFLAWRSISLASKEAELVTQTYALLRNLEFTVNHVMDVESGSRDFALTGKEALLAPYETARDAVSTDLETLRSLTANEPVQRERLAVLETQIKASLVFAESIVQRRQSTHASPGMQEVSEGRTLLEGMRATSKEMEDQERQRLDRHTATATLEWRATRVFVLASTLLGMALLGLAGLAIRREINISARARVQLKVLNADLERRVEERTAALRESESRLASVISSAMDAIITVDEQHRIVLFNQAAEKVFQCPAAEALGGPLNPFIPERCRAAHQAHIQRYSTTGITNRSMDRLDTLTGLRSNGEEFPMEASLSQVETHNGKLFTVILRDVTQQERWRRLREQAESDLAKKMEELARSNAELEQFAYVASHDLQEPLRMVATYTQLLAERYRGKLDDSADKYIHYAVDGAQRMQTLIQDLLQFSRVGRNGKERKGTDCKIVAERALHNLQAAIRESGATVNLGSLPKVVANEGQLAQVFQNLIGNAIKFRGSEPPVVQVQAELQGDQWLFAVSDNGIGIEPEWRQDIFTVFKRLHTRAEYPGNGIGLAICRKIVEQHGGRIWVESAPGRGSSFQFTLPMKNTLGMAP